MLTYRTTNIIIGSLLAVLILLHLWGHAIHWGLFAGLAIVYVAIVVWGSARIDTGFYMPVSCAAATTEKVVALSFDDGPHAAYSPQLLNILQQNKVPATFFCIGKHIPGNEALLQRIVEEGHLIGNHTWSHHFWFDMFTSSRMLSDMQQMDREVFKQTGKRLHLFRPPYGVLNPALRRAIKKGGYLPVGWSIRSLDTVIKEKEQLLARVVKQLQPGAVILLHDTSEATVQILPELITYIHQEGYTIKHLDDLLKIPAYA
jgi:peptidoglycan/xylan/chitin deacetylase (PgdA/CDA1 family)